MFFSIPWLYVIDISMYYFEEYIFGHLKDSVRHPQQSPPEGQ